MGCGLLSRQEEKLEIQARQRLARSTKLESVRTVIRGNIGRLHVGAMPVYTFAGPGATRWMRGERE